MRAFLAATALFSAMTNLSFKEASAREFTDPGTTWLLGSFAYDYRSAVPDGGGGQSFSSHMLQIDARPAFFVAPRFFLGPNLQWQKGWTDDYSTSILFTGAHAGLAFSALAAPIKPYFGLGFSLYNASTEFEDVDDFSGETTTETTKTDGTQFQVFGGWLYQIDHLGIGLEIGFTRINLDGGHINDILLKGTFSGLLF